MTYYVTGALIKRIRIRKGWKQIRVQEELDKHSIESGAFEEPLTADSNSDEQGALDTLSRVENLRQFPTDKTMSRFMDVLDMPMDEFFTPYLENITSEAILLRERVIYNLDIEESLPSPRKTNRTSELTLLENILDKQSRINRQFLISCNVREALLRDPIDLQAITKQIMEGIKLTFPEFDAADFDGKTVLFEESELIHALAKVYEKTNRINEAIDLLTNLQKNIQSIPSDYYSKERKLPAILSTLARILLNEKRYDDALTLCNDGIRTSLQRNTGRSVPILCWYKALCLFYMGRKDECEKAAQHAYHSAACFRITGMCERIYEDAQNIMGITIETYGLEALTFTAPEALTPQSPGRAETTDIKHIGDLIRFFRLTDNIKQKEIYEGLCTQGYFSKIESGKITHIDPLLLFAVFQRLGRDISLYYEIQLPVNLHEGIELLRHSSEVTIDETSWKREQTLGLLDGHEILKNPLGLQWYTQTKAIYDSRDKWHITKGGYDTLAPFEQALKMTRPDYKEGDVYKYRLTNVERACIKAFARHFTQTGEVKRGIDLFKKIVEGVDRSFKDGYMKAMELTKQHFSYSDSILTHDNPSEDDFRKLLGEMESMSNVYARHGITRWLYNYLGYMGLLNLELGNKEKSIALTAMAYYGFEIAGNEFHRNVLHQAGKSDLGVEWK
ncbi:MAG: hypothetical protein FWD90_14215 [Defluviitaleaceae bacterium]|nr:hypothetical protein [Defluviitaleaceae bacterium]